MERTPPKVVDDLDPLIYKVEAPAQSLADQAREAVEPVRKLLISDDDPFRPYRNKTPWERALVFLFYVFPIFDWLSTYKLEYLSGDIISGLTVASLNVPQGLAYAKLAHLPPVNGLYCDVVPPLVYTILGSSRHIVIGPVAVVSLLMGNLLNDEYDYRNKKLFPQYYNLAITATFFAGIIQLALGLCRLGFIVDFMSHAVIVGFMAGAAITIGCSQFKSFLGYKTFTNNTDIVSVFDAVTDGSDQFSYESFVIATAFLVFLLSLKILNYYKKGNRIIFFANALGPLISVIVSTLVVYCARLDKEGVAVVGNIKKGLNPTSDQHILFDDQFLGRGVRIGFVAGLIALTEAIAIARTFASLKGYHIDGNKEMVAYGTMNIAGSLTSCYVTTGSFSRSAVNFAAGGNTPLVLVVVAAVNAIVLGALTQLFHYLPNAVLSSIIINAVVTLIDIPSAYRVWKTDKLDFIALLGAFFGVIFVSVEIGILIAVCISLIKVIVQATRPQVRVLGKLPGTTIYRNVQQYAQASTTDGILILRIDSTLYFANALYVQETIMRHAERYQEDVGKRLQFLILEMTPVADIDTTAIHALEELLRGLGRQGIQLGLSNPSKNVLWKLQASDFIEELGEQWLFLSSNEGVKICSMHLKEGIGHNV